MDSCRDDETRFTVLIVVVVDNEHLPFSRFDGPVELVTCV